MYHWIPITDRDDYANLTLLSAKIPNSGSAFDLGTVAERLKEGLSDVVKGMLVEFSYVDKDYRSTYYHFYAKKGLRYKQDCLRIHFFDGDVSFDLASLSLTHGKGMLAEHYLGFVTVRPTYQYTLGRSVLAPRIRSGADGKVIVSKHKAHVLGYDLEVSGFPWMEQHSDISVCAHAACWAILRHYSERYRKYRELLTHDVTRLAHTHDPGGLRPSRGLQLMHAESVFSAAGNFPVVNFINPAAPSDERRSFLGQMFAYLESGFPLFLGIAGEHAVAAIGYKWKPELQVEAAGIKCAWDMVEALVVVDDNHIPYNSLAYSASDRQRYGINDIHAFIAPLPEKIFYPADAVDAMSGALPNMLVWMNFPEIGDRVVRYFITTVAALRRHIRTHITEFHEQLANVLMQLPMAQFVWVIEYASHGDWNAGRVSVTAIVDATASLHDTNVLWAIYGHGQALFFDRVSGDDPWRLLWTPVAGSSYGRIETNLRPVQAI